MDKTPARQGSRAELNLNISPPPTDAGNPALPVGSSAPPPTLSVRTSALSPLGNAQAPDLGSAFAPPDSHSSGPEDFVIRIRRVVPMSPRSSAPDPSMSNGRLIPAMSVASSSSSGSADLNNCTAPDAPRRRESRPLDKGGRIEAQRTDDRVHATDLGSNVLSIANAGMDHSAVLSPDSLGLILVAVQSKDGKLKLEGDRIKHLLRGALKIHGFEPSSGGSAVDLNVVTTMSEPFMRYHLGTPEIDRVLETVWAAWLKAPNDEALKPAIDLICGEQRSLKSSGLTEPMKRLLLSIDRNVILWFQKNGTGKPAHLFSARKNALVAFLSTRSIAYVWMNKLVEKTRGKPELKHELTALIQQLNSYIAKQAGGFLHDVLLSQQDQPNSARRYIEVLDGGHTLKSKPSLPVNNSSSSTGSSWERLLSPRGLQASNAERATKEKETRQRLVQAKFADALAVAIGLDKLDPACGLHMKEKFSTMARRGFDNVLKNPVAYALKFVDEFYELPKNRSKAELSRKVAEAIGQLNPATHPALFAGSSDESSGSDNSDSKIDSVDDDSSSQ